MNLLDLIFKNNNEKDYQIFSNWLDNVLEQKMPQDLNAFNFNFYEGTKNTYDIQLIGTNEYDENDEDWACTDYFTTEENICYITRTNKIKDWKKGLIYMKKIIERYLEEGKYASRIKGVDAIGFGFVDGDNEIIFRNEAAKRKKKK